MENYIRLKLCQLPIDAEFCVIKPENIWWEYDYSDWKVDPQNWRYILINALNPPNTIMFTTFFDNGDALYGHLTEYLYWIPKDLKNDLNLFPSVEYHGSIAEQTRSYAHRY